jgi:hypothetical protein
MDNCTSYVDTKQLDDLHIQLKDWVEEQKNAELAEAESQDQSNSS